MAVRAGADDVKGLRQRWAERSVALQDGAQRIDFGWGPVGEVGDGAVVDLAVFAEALTEEDRGRGVAVGDDGDVHVDMIRQCAALIQAKYHYLHDYIISIKSAQPIVNKRTYMRLGLELSV